MDFVQQFKQSVTSRRMVNMNLDPELLISVIYHYDQKCSCLSLTAGSNVAAELPFAFQFQPLNYYLLLYITKGGGKLSFDKEQIAVTEGSLLLLHCSIPFLLQSLLLPWNFKIYFIPDHGAELFSPFFSKQPAAMINTRDYPPAVSELDLLDSLPECLNVSWQLEVHRALTNLFCMFSLPLCPAPIGDDGLPPYLKKMKQHLDNHYTESFSLSFYEEMLKLNKYRLCREFSQAYGTSPLKYVNQKRLKTAEIMLLTTELNVLEISSTVGYENVNHFINLFKRNAGCTPGQFRQKARQAPPVSHFPVQ